MYTTKVHAAKNTNETTQAHKDNSKKYILLKCAFFKKTDEKIMEVFFEDLVLKKSLQKSITCVRVIMYNGYDK